MRELVSTHSPVFIRSTGQTGCVKDHIMSAGLAGFVGQGNYTLTKQIVHDQVYMGLFRHRATDLSTGIERIWVDLFEYELLRQYFQIID